MQMLACVCVVASLLFSSGCELTPSAPIDHPTILAFSMPGCGGCVKDKPRLVQLERDGYIIQRINISLQPKLRRKYRVVSVPLYLVIRRERIVLRTNNLNLVIRTVQDGRSVQK